MSTRSQLAPVVRRPSLLAAARALDRLDAAARSLVSIHTDHLVGLPTTFAAPVRAHLDLVAAQLDRLRRAIGE